VKKVIWLTNQQPLHTELSSSDRTDFVLLVPASLSKASQSGLDGDCMWAKTQIPYNVCIALGSHPTFQWYELKRYQAPQTRRHLGHAVSGVPDEPLPPDAVYAHGWYTSLLLWDRTSYQTEHTRDSLSQENPPLSVPLWERNHCLYPATNASQWSQRTPDDLSLREGLYPHQWRHDCLVAQIRLFF
jgi:hypothetical protein